MSGCRQGCCRTPFGVCARQRACRCHASDPKPRTFDDLLAEARAQQAREDQRSRSLDRLRA